VFEESVTFETTLDSTSLVRCARAESEFKPNQIPLEMFSEDKQFSPRASPHVNVIPNIETRTENPRATHGFLHQKDS